MTALTPLPAIEDLIPQRDTMLLLDRVLAFADEKTVAEYAPRASAWYADREGNMPAWMGVELMAQTIAAHVALARRREGTSPKLGVLLGTRAYTSTVASFTAQVPLRIEANRLFSEPEGLGAYLCAITDPAGARATATLKVLETSDIATILQSQAGQA